VTLKSRDLPDGTVTMVFTDIVGSTALLARLGKGYGGLLADHRERVRAITARHGGQEVDTQGDAFFIVFRRASDAVTAARDIVALGGAVPVRIGMHTGEPSRTAEGYVGMDVHLASRIAASGSGGQILLSRATRELVPAQAVRDLGVHRLKDVGDVHLYQHGEADFPPIRSLGRGNIVRPAEPPLGRQRELTELRALVLDGARLVTLTGAGGIGKTTVARALASELDDRFPDGLWFVDLSAVSAPDLVEPAVAATVGSHAGVVERLHGSSALLVLDNLEQVLDVAPSIGQWLTRCPRLVVLATSREGLRLSVERQYPLAPLDEGTAVELFRRRGRTVAPQFDANESDLLPLCRRLDCIPLAVELAAARVRSLTTGQLLARLDERFSVLTGGARDVPLRQRTLEATIAWSYDLLDSGEQAVFARLAVFAGGWTLEAAEVVVGAGLDDLESLVAKSLVWFEDGRFGMLESIREYAAARLAGLADAASLRRAHAAHYAALVDQAEPELTGARQDAWLELLASEDDNLRAALEWSVEDPLSREPGLALAAGLVLFWYLRSRPAEGAARLAALLAVTEPRDSTVRARALWGAGLFRSILGDPDASGQLTEALDMSRRIGDRSLTARSLDVLGLLAFFANAPQESRALLEECIGEARAAGDDWCLADALGTIGSIYPLIGELERGRSSGEEGLRLARSRGDLQGMRMSLFGIALTARRAGDARAAIAAAEEGLDISRQLGDAFFASYFLWILASVELEAGTVSRAREQADEALRLARDVGAPLLAVCALEVRASVARAQGRDDLARSLLTEAEGIAADGAVPGSYVSEALRALGCLDADEGNHASAAKRLVEAVELARSVLDAWAEGRAAADLERLAPT
jgi:predicted ATPase